MPYETGDSRLPERFWNKVTATSSGCWRWIGAINSKGYGNFRFNGKTVQAHRLCFLTLTGQTTLPLDHLCRNTWCVNPEHMEPVTTRVNIARGTSPGAVLHRLGVCSKGHSLATAYVAANGTRHCRICAADRARARRAAYRSANPLPPRKVPIRCRNGHTYSEVGVYLYKGKRLCMECRREADRRRSRAS